VCVSLFPGRLTVFELLAHDGARGGGDVVGGVLLGIGRCNDGHQMVSVGWVDLNTDTRIVSTVSTALRGSCACTRA